MKYSVAHRRVSLPELLVPGNPPPRNNFRDFQYLVNGSGPLPLMAVVFESNQLQVGSGHHSNFYPTRTPSS